VLEEFVEHYREARPHQGLQQRCPYEPVNRAPIGPVSARTRSATPRRLPSI
jgi:hypothetical protein